MRRFSREPPFRIVIIEHPFPYIHPDAQPGRIQDHLASAHVDARTSLLANQAKDASILAANLEEARTRRRLYTSHFLSTWNSRVFELGAVLFLARIFASTLLPMSIYAFARGFSAILFAPSIGKFIDIGNRLRVVRLSIVVQRLAVAISCVIFYILSTKAISFNGRVMGWFTALTLLACFEKLSSTMNLISVERDWVVVVADGNIKELSTLNSQMRRIDLMCKIFGPLFVSLLDSTSTRLAIVTVFTMNVASVLLEYFAIARVYFDYPALQAPKQPRARILITPEPPSNADTEPERPHQNPVLRLWQYVGSCTRQFGSDSKFYFCHQAALPSICCALLYLTVLSFSGQMVTYLLLAGYTSAQSGLARTLAVAFEVLATWIAPWLIARIGLIRAGLWLSSWQAASLTTGTTLFWYYLRRNPLAAASGLVCGTIVSRLGLRGFDLCTQVITQENVEAESRGKFSSIEAMLQNSFELMSYTCTIIFQRPEQFQYPVLISTIAITTASFIFSIFARLQRGHLFHTERIPFCRCCEHRQFCRDEATDRIISQSN